MHKHKLRRRFTRDQQVKRNKALGLAQTQISPLEQRLLFTAANVFATFDGSITTPGGSTAIPIHLTTSDFAFTGGLETIGLHVLRTGTSSLVATAVTVTNSLGQTVAPLYTSSSLASGPGQSLVLVQLPQGNYNVSFGAASASSGAYELQAFLAGDVNGDRAVTNTDATLIEAAYGSAPGQPKYNVSADMNLDGAINSFDLAVWTKAHADTTDINPMSLSGALASPSPIITLSDGSQLINSHSLSISGTTEPGATVTLDDNGNNYSSGSTTAAGNGSYTLTATASEGLNGFTIKSSDRFGQTLTSTLAVTADTTPPATPTLTLDSASDTPPLGDSQTTLSSVALDGTTSPSASVSLYSGSAATGTPLATTAAAANGSFQFTGVALALGSNTFTVKATERAGNFSTTTASFTRLPVSTSSLVVSAALAHDTGISSTDGITNDPTVSGTVTDTAPIASFVAGFDSAPLSSYLDITSQLNSGAFTLNAAAITSINGGSSLVDGPHVLHLIATDTSSVTGSYDLSFTLKTSVAAPVFALAVSSQTQSLGDHKTTLTSVTLTGTTGANLTVTLAGGSPTTSDTNGNFSFTNIPLTSGPNSFTTTVTDVAGNVATSNQIIFLVPAVQSGGQVVLSWDAAAVTAIQTDASTPEFASRMLAIMSAAMYDAGNSVDNASSFLYVHAASPAGASDIAAVSQAAYSVLSYIYPAQQANFATVLATSLASVSDPTAKANGIAVGNQVAATILQMRANDGYINYVNYTPGSGNGVWIPTYPSYMPAENPQWATLTPFLMTSDSQFRGTGPTPLASAQWQADYNQIMSLGSVNSTTRTADETQIAKFWNDPTGTATPPGHWNAIASVVAAAKNLNLSDSTRLFAQLNVALGDAAIVAWDDKFTYNFWRPITAVQTGGGNANLTADPTWVPLLTTPPFPEYVSGHSTFSAAAAAVLDSFFGPNTPFTIGSTSPGMAGIKRSYTGFDQAAQEAAISRVYAGIHFLTSVDDGLTAGTALGNYIVAKFADLSDTTAPVVTYVNTQNQAVDADTPVTGIVTDNLSGVAKLSGRFDNGSSFNVSFGSSGQFSVTPTYALNGSADGTHVLHLITTDNAGNISSSYDYTFTLDTIAPVLSVTTPALASGQSSISLTGAITLAGAVDGTGSAVASLTYHFDNGTIVPVGVTSGAFSQNLDFSALSAGSHTLYIKATDAAGNVATTTLPVTVPSLAPPQLSSYTPTTGSLDIGSTYRPEIFFTRAINLSTLNGNDFYLSDSTGARVGTTIVPSDDGTYAWLFPTSPMPGGSTMTVTVDGTQIKGAADGAPLDAANTGSTTGSVWTYTFTTVSVAPIANTSLSGIVADPGPDLKPGTADDVSNGPDGVLGTPDDVYKLPIAGVTVSVVGTGLTAVTDANGYFSFPSMPAGDVKLEVDGTTASSPPAGYYFPQMVMDLNVTAGIANTVMSDMAGTGMGNAPVGAVVSTAPGVYLPRVASSVLTPIPSVGTTDITASAAGAPDLTQQQRSDLSIDVPGGVAIGANGQKMNSFDVGISVVPASIVMDMLPAGVSQHTFDITVQAPGVATFSTPVQMTFPNVFNAAPGTQLNFLSFDHTTGRLVIEGTATVSADGLSVVTDPGTGITHPGWHGLTPPGNCNFASPPPPPPPPPSPTDTTLPEQTVVQPLDYDNTGSFNLSWTAGPAPANQPPPPPPAPGCPPAPTPPKPGTPYEDVTISVDGPLSTFMAKSAGADYGPGGGSFVLVAGSGQTKTLGLQDLHINPFTIPADILYGSQITVTDVNVASDGSKTTQVTHYDLYRLLDVSDDSATDDEIDFPKTFDNLPAGEMQTEPLTITMPSSIAPTITVDGSDFAYNNGVIQFKPASAGLIFGESLELAEPNSNKAEISLGGEGLAAQNVNFSLAGFTRTIIQLIAANPSFASGFIGLFPSPMGDPTAFNAEVAKIYDAVKVDLLADYAPVDGAATTALTITDGSTSGVQLSFQMLNTVNDPNSALNGMTVNTLTSAQIGGVSCANAQWADFNKTGFNALVANESNISPAQLRYDFSDLVNLQATDNVNLYLNVLAGQLDVSPVSEANVEVRLANALAHEIGHDLGSIHLRGLLANQTYIDGSIMGLGAIADSLNSFGPTLAPIVQYALGLPVDGTVLAPAQGFYSVYNYYKTMVNLETYGFDGLPSPGDPGTDLDIGAGYLQVYNSVPTAEGTAPSAITSLDFGNTTTGTPATKTIYLFNDGDQKLDISNIHVLNSGSGFSVVGLSALPVTLPAAGATDVQLAASSYAVTVEYNPTQSGQSSDSLEIDSDTQGGAPVLIPLTGTSVEINPTIGATVGNSNNNVGGVEVGGTASVSTDATITNSGENPLSISSIGLADGAGDFTLSGIPVDLSTVPLVLATGQSFSFEVTFAPGQLGLARAVISVSSNDPSSPNKDFTVVGTGLASSPVAHWGNDYVSIGVPGPGGSTNTIRERSDDNGYFTVFLPPLSDYSITVFDPDTGLVAHGQGVTGPSGQGSDLTGDLVFGASTSPDSDGDGIPDDIKDCIGISLTKSNANPNGVDDFTALQEGLNPVASEPVESGIIASLPLQGEADKVVLTGSVTDSSGQTAYIATGSYGLAIVDASKLLAPVVLGQLQLSGNSTDVAVDLTDGVAAVASNAGGLNLINISNPDAPTVIQTINVDASNVELVNGVVYASVGGSLESFDALTGEPLGNLNLNGSTITGMAHDGNTLYTMDSGDRLVSIDVSNISMVILGSVQLPHGGGQLSVGSGTAYVSASDYVYGGYLTVNISDPTNMTLIQDASLTATTAGYAPVIVDNGSGVGVIAVGGGRGTTAAVDVYDTADPTVTNAFETLYDLPDSPSGLAIASGIAYVADGSGGLQVVNYLGFDNKGIAPTVSQNIAASVEVPGSPGSVYEGSIIPVTVSANDDVQVRDIELLVNGQVVENSVSFPWDLSFVAPAITAGASTVTIQVRATDTGGNTTLSTPITLTLVHDTRPPTVVYNSPSTTSRLQNIPAITVTFNKAIDVSKLSTSGITFVGAGPDGIFGTADDVTIAVDALTTRNLNRTLIITPATPLTAGLYQLTISPSIIVDLSGNQLAAPYVDTFTKRPATQPIAFNTPVNDIVGAPGEVETYTFTGAPGQTIYFDALGGNSNQIEASLTSPGGTVLFSNYIADQGPLVLSESGTYKLALFSYGSSTGNYSFQLLSNTAAPVAALNANVSVSLAPYSAAMYIVHGAAGQQLLFSNLTTKDYDYYSYWTLYGPGGQKITSTVLDYYNYDYGTSQQYDDLSAVLPSSGSYMLVLSSGSSAAIDAEFQVTAPPTTTNSLTLGAPVNGNISAYGQTDNYTFTGAAGQVLYLTSTTGSLLTTLTSPSGQNILNAGGGYYAQNTGPVTLLENGTYTLSVSSESSEMSDYSTGAYQFQLTNLSASSPLALNTPVTGTLANGSSIQAYTISGTAGEHLVLNNLSATNNNYNATWTLFNPAGTSLGSTYLTYEYGSNNIGVTLPMNGTYFLLLLSNGSSAPVSYSIEALNPNTTTTALTLGTTYSGDIATPGQVDQYTFTGSIGQVLFYDGITNQDFTATLTSPTGKQIFSTGAGSDTSTYSPLLEAGTYTLQIAANSNVATTGAYSFRLLDVASATSLQNGDTISSTLSPGTSAVLYSIAGTAGEHLFLDNLSTQDPADYNSRWSLYSPTGQELDSSALVYPNYYQADNLDVILPSTGSYLLVVQGGNSTHDVSYSFGVSTPAVNSIPLTLGQVTSGNISLAGQKDDYIFTGTAGQTLYYDGLSNSGFTASLLSPAGTQLYSLDAGQNNQPYTLTQSGLYTLQISPEAKAASTGSYSFRLLDVSAAPLLTVGGTTTSTLSPRAGTDLYRISGTAGQRLFLDNLSTVDPTDYTTQWILYGPQGNAVDSNFLKTDSNAGNNNLDYTFTSAGTYVLAVVGSDLGKDVSYSFITTTPPVVSSALTLNTVVSGNLAVAGETDNYTFTGSVGQRIFFDNQAGLQNLTATLIAPGGNTVVSSTTGYDFGPLTLLQNGTYTLSFAEPQGDSTTGAYTFRLLDAAAQPVLTLGAPATSGSLANSTATVYGVNATAGQQLLFTSSVASNATWSVYAPNNQLLTTTSMNLPLSVLPSTSGLYLLVLTADNGAVNYSIAASNSTGPATAALGAEQGGVLSPSQTLSYQFTVPSGGAAIYLDNQDIYSSVVEYVILDGSGDTVATSTSSNDAGPLQLAAGNYSLEALNTSRSAAAAYAFRLSDTFADAQAISLGATFSGTLNPGESSDLYRFSGNAGQSIYVNGLEGANSGDVSALVLAPDGSTVYFGNLPNNSAPLVLPVTGVYRVIISGYDTSSESYSLRILDVASAPSFALGDTVNGTLASGGSTDLYTLTGGTAGERIVFQSLVGNANDYYSNWVLYDSSGQEVNGAQLFNGTTSFVATLPADGNYTLAIIGRDSGGPAAYSFTAFQPATVALPLTIGNSVVSGTFNIGQIESYTFTAAAGQTVLYDGIQSPGASVALIDPSGNTIENFGASGTPGPVTLATGGSYKLVFDPGVNIGGYQFRLLDVSQQPALVFDQSVTGTIDPASAGVAVYTFSGLASQRVFFTNLLTSGLSSSSAWVLYGPTQQVAYNSLASNFNAVLPVAGSYTLVIVSNDSSSSVNYQFSADSPATNNITPYSVGQTITGNLSPGASTDQYQFTGTQGQTIYFDGIDAHGDSVTASLLAPDGTYLFSVNADTDAGPVQLPLDGNYRLVIAGNGTAGSYGFRLSDIAAAPSLTFGTTVSGNLSPGNRTDLYTFSGTAGERVFFSDLSTLSSSDYSSRWTLYGPDGTALSSSYLLYAYYGNDLQAQLPSDGTYVLAVAGGDTGNAVAYSFEASVAPSNLAAINIGDTVSGNINAGNQLDSYTFNGTAGQGIYVDMLSLASGLIVRLTDPNGQLIYPQNTGDIGPITLSTDGTYTLTVSDSQDGGAVGAYQFHLLSTENVPSVALDGSTVASTLTPGTSAAFYTFAGTPGQTIFLNNLSATDPNDSTSSWYLYDPSGALVAESPLVYTYATRNLDVTLASSGNYMLVVSGGNQNNPVAYSFSASIAAVNTGPITLGSTVAGDIVQPGQTDNYTFDASSGQRFLYDLQSTSNLSVTLYAPDGSQVYGGAGSLLTLPQSGQYTLSVAGYGATGTTGAYALQALSDSSAATVTIGSTLTGTLASGGDVIYSITGTQGQHLLLNNQSVTSTSDYQSRWNLYGPTGQYLASNYLRYAYYGDNIDLILPANGTYTLLLTGWTGGTVPYSFTASSPAITTAALTLGTTVNGSISSAGVQNNYTFAGTAGQLLYYDGQNTSVAFDATLTDPQGNQVFYTGAGSDYGVFQLQYSGVYTLNISPGPGTSTTGSYSFRLSDVSTAPSVSVGVTVNGTLNPGGSSNLYTIAGTAGQNLFLDNLSQFGTSDYGSSWAIYGPTGNFLQSARLLYQYYNYYQVNMQLTLPSTGNYTIVVTGDETTNINYSFQATISPVTSTPLSLNTLVNGSITSLGGTNNYTFTGSPGQQLYFDGQGTSAGLFATLRRPDGQQLFSNDAADDSSLFVLTEAGTYTLSISAPNSSGNTGTYAFQLLDAADAPALGLSSTPVTGTLNPSSSAAIYSITGTAGQRLFLDNLTTPSSNDYYSQWTLYGPTGQQLSSAYLDYQYYNYYTDNIDVTLPSTGAYTLVLSGSGTNSGPTIPYSFTVTQPPLTTTALTLNTAVSGNLSVVGENDDYTFTGTPGQTLYFDAAQQAGTFESILTSPSGVQVFNGEFNSHGPFVLAESGTYTLTIAPANSSASTGAYSFQMLDLATSASVTLGTPVSGSFVPGVSSAVLYQITGLAGQRLFFNPQGIDPNGAWSLYSAGNKQLASTNLTYGFEVVLPANGIYDLVLTGSNGSSPVDYGFTVTAAITNTAPLTMGVTYNSSIASAGQHDIYTFAGTAGQRVYFDSLLEGSGSLEATLLSPSGVKVFAGSIYNDQSFVTLVETGTYELVIAAPPGDPTVGTYSFQVIDAAAQPALGLNQTVTGALDPGLSSSAYNLVAVAGESFNIAAQGTDSNGSWTIIGPDNSVIATGSIAADLNFTAPAAGDYILLLQGSDATNPVDFSFDVLLQ